MKSLLFGLSLLLCVTGAFGDDSDAINIVEVSRRLAMSSTETVPPKQFLLNRGTEEGLKLGDVYDVSRWYPVVSRMTGEPVDFQKVRLGAVEVVSVGPHSAVAQQVEIVPEQFLNLDYPVMMVGDVAEARAS